MISRSLKLFLHKLAHWEYWPFQVVYIPIYGLWIYYAIKTRSLFFFNAVNPSIKNGGFVMESKKKIYELIPQKYYAKTLLMDPKVASEEMINRVAMKGLNYPVIAKPDVGLRGAAVKKINSAQDLLAYHQKANFYYLIQDYIDLPNEIGVFYVRYPNQKNGSITGIVHKETLTVIGDGLATIEDLLNRTPRHQMQLKALLKEFKNKLTEILPKGEKLTLMPYGSHARGAKFTDYSHLITEELTDTLNHICRKIDGFYYGRLDIMYNSMEELEKGEQFKIVELNGAKSEPTHIYDPKHSLFFAWKELAKHLTFMYQISILNHHNGKLPYLGYRNGMKQLNEHFLHYKKIAGFI